MNDMHCQCCRGRSMQNKLGEPCDKCVISEDVTIASTLERSSCRATDGLWFVRTSSPEVADIVSNNFPGASNLQNLHETLCILSMGDLVCPASAVAASQHSKLSGTEFSFLNDTLSQIGLDNCTNQAPGRDGQIKDFLQGLTYINHGYMQPCGITEVFDPATLQLGNIVVDESSVGIQPPLRSNITNLSYPAQQPSAYLSESSDDGSFVIASSAAQSSSFMDLGGIASYEDVCHQSSFNAMSDAQPGIDLHSLLELTTNDGGSFTAGQVLFPEVAINPSNRHDEANHPVDGQTPTLSQGEQSSPGTPAILASSGQGKGKTKMISVYCCTHNDCDYTAKIWRDVQRHLGSKKHGGSSLRFPCTVEGCNALKDNTRRDNLRRHMKMVHDITMPEMKKGRREKRCKVQSQAQK